MQVLSKKMGAWMAVAALGAASLFAQTPPPARHNHQHGRFAAALNLTDAQKTQMRSIFQQTRQSLQAAVKAGNSNQIQQLAATEGTEMGQLAAIHASARAQMFKMLTPEQQQKLSTLQTAMHRSRRGGPGAAVQN
jgi:Spy/CpxP family protein refolding chaperone